MTELLQEANVVSLSPSRLVPQSVQVRLWLTTVALVLLTGCAVGPKYSRPAVKSPEAFRGAPPGDKTSLADLKWFEVFKDEQLQQLVRRALVQNYDLRDAVARVEAARAALGITHADQLPTVGAGANLTTLRFSTGGSFPLPPGISQNRSFGSLLVNLLSYEADIWGRVRHATDAARANLLASEENRKALMTIVVGDVASAYFSLLELDAELGIARRTLATRQESLKLIQLRQQRGLASLLDVRQGEQLVQTAAEDIPNLERQIEQTENQISLLLGQNPGAIQRDRPLTEQEQPPAVPPGLPSSLLERRPDIRAAEQNLVAANANIGVARAAYFPQISLTGYLGSQTSALSSFFVGTTTVWQLVPQATQPVFTGGRLRSGVDLANAQQQIALVQYERVIQTAFREVSDALVQHQRTREQLAEQERLITALRDRSRLAYMRYQGGVDTLLNALDADRDLFAAELGLAQTQRNQLLALVQLYRALGGGWQQ